MSDPLPLRCFCSRHPLLGVCGRDADSGEPFIHIKSWKSQKLYTEVVVTGVGSAVRIRCRECLRWHKVVIRLERVMMREEELPATISVG